MVHYCYNIKNILNEDVINNTDLYPVSVCFNGFSQILQNKNWNYVDIGIYNYLARYDCEKFNKKIIDDSDIFYITRKNDRPNVEYKYCLEQKDKYNQKFYIYYPNKLIFVFIML